MLLLQADALDAEARWSSVPENTDSFTAAPIIPNANTPIRRRFFGPISIKKAVTVSSRLLQALRPFHNRQLTVLVCPPWPLMCPPKVRQNLKGLCLVINIHLKKSC